MLKNMKIGMRLGFSFGLILLMLAALGIYAISRISSINDTITLVVQDRMVKTRQSTNIVDNLNIASRALRNMLLLDDSTKIRTEKVRVDSVSAANTKLYDSLEASVKTEEGKRILAKAGEKRLVYSSSRSDLIDLLQKSKRAEAITMLFGTYRQAQNDYMDAVSDLSDFQYSLAVKDGDSAAAIASQLKLAMILCISIMILASLLIAFLLTRSIVRPINDCIAATGAIARGEIPKVSTEQSWGEFEDMRNSLNECIQGLHGLEEAEHFLQRMAVNDYTVSVNNTYPGIYSRVIDATNSVKVRILHAIEIMQKLAVGDMEAELAGLIRVGKRSDQDTFIPAFILGMESIQALIKDVNLLGKAAVEGRLAIRADATKHQGDFRKVVQGVNDTLDAVIGPLNVSAKYVDDISKGNIPAKITDTYNGDFNTIKVNLNRCIDAVNLLVADANMLSAAAVQGKLATRADATKHEGDYRKVVQGVNDTLDAVIGPLNVSAKYVSDISQGIIPTKIVDTYNGDFNSIKNNLNQCIVAVNMLVEDANMLSKAAVEGRLATRADATKHQGDFRRVVQGVNDTLDAVINPVNEAAQVLEKVAARDMTPRVMGNYQGDLGRIKVAVNTAVDNLDKALAQVSQATFQVSSAAQQISAGSQSLAQGANEQASSLEEVSSSLEEMASMTKQNADNANLAKNLSGEADGNARQGSEAMGRMNTAIIKIKDSSDQTAKIVKTIDEIAMQTNLLALNAAVEAARAGEAGRGFAVVAEEVRNLAQRSAQAAKSTADMIGESVKNADDGVKIAQDVARSFESIAISSRKVNDLIAEIASASKEQSQGIEQVSTAVTQMDKVTQQTAANAEESASSSEELSSQAEELQSMVGQFQITQDLGGRTVAIAQTHHRQALPPPNRKAPPSPAKRNRMVDPEQVIPMDDATLREF